MSDRNDDGFFSARDGLTIYHRKWPRAEPAKAILAVVHGYLEHGGRYGFVADYFGPKGYGVYTLDQRGHGRSGGRRGFTSSFQEYLYDLDSFLELIQEREGDQKLFLVGHSFGGLVALRYAIQNPEGLAGLVLSSPFIGNKVPIPALKLMAVKVLARVAPTLALETGLDPGAVSHDPAVVAAYTNDPLVTTRFTTKWTSETLRAQEEALAQAGELRIPALVMQALDDKIADPDATRRLFDRLTTRDKEWRGYEGYYHEIFNEVGRDRVFKDLEEWLQKRL